MDDASKLGPLWVAQLKKEVAARRNRAAENLLTINPEGDFAKQHLIFIDAANAMLAAPQLVAACREMLRYETGACFTDDRPQDEIDAGKEAAFKQIRATLAAAGAA